MDTNNSAEISANSESRFRFANYYLQSGSRVKNKSYLMEPQMEFSWFT